MKILFTHNHVIYKGGWGRTFPIATGLVKLGDEVTIITMADKPTLLLKKTNVDGVKIVIFPSILPKKRYYDPISIILKIIYVLCHKYDIVHSDVGQRPQSGLPCRISKMLKGTTYISEWMDDAGKGGLYDSKSWLFKLALGNYELKYEVKDRQYADGVIVLADPLYHKALEIRNDDNIVKIHGGCLVDKIPSIIDNSKCKEKLNIDNDILIFGYIDQSIDQMEIQPILDAIIKLDICEKVRFLIFGGKNSTQLDVPDNLRNSIVQMGWIDFSKEYEKLLAVDVFVLFKKNNTSAKAGWPNAFGDFIACGRPVILKPIGETIRFVDEHSEGFYIVKEESDILEYINDMYMDRQKIINKGIYNRKLAENNLSWDIKAKEYRDFYNIILNKIKCK